MFDIMHISDFHINSGEFKIAFLDNVVKYIKKANPDLVVHTGDYVHKGRGWQYEKLEKYYFKKLESPLLSVPGNHDVKSGGLELFKEYISPLRSYKVFDEKDTIVVGLRSPIPDMSEGFISIEQREWMSKKLSKINPKTGEEYNNKVLALHHHLIDVPVGSKEDKLLDAGETLETAAINDVDLILMGHRHIPYIWRIQSMLLVYCGTSASKKYRGKSAPSFNHIIINDDTIEVKFINSITLEPLDVQIRKHSTNKYVHQRR
jgi:3',5'-cyclic AMP phosphodiesterase CpdA